MQYSTGRINPSRKVTHGTLSPPSLDLLPKRMFTASDRKKNRSTCKLADFSK